MRRGIVLVSLALVVGFLAGLATRSVLEGRDPIGGAAPAGRDAKRFVEVPEPELAFLRERAKRADELQNEVVRLRDRIVGLERPVDDEEELPVGSRRPDGTIVGGARWTPMFTDLATGFLDSILSQFLDQANLSKDQERRLRDLIRLQTPIMMQLTADFTNGDMSGDQVYELLEAHATDIRAKVHEMLDGEQYQVFEKFEGAVGGIMRQQMLHNELTTLKSGLDLDSEQEAKVKRLLQERFRRVEERITVPLPNVLMKSIRREQDREIYDATALEIRRLLDRRQQAAFDRLEAAAPGAPFIHRSQLLPK